MGWTHSTDDEFHEMWIRPEFANAVSNGAVAVRDGVSVLGVVGGSGEDAWRPAGEVVGWRVACNCERTVTGSLRPQRSQWVSPEQWVRVPSPRLEDGAAGRWFVDDESTAALEERTAAEDAAKALWHRDHLRLVDIDEEIAVALAAHRAAAIAIDVAVARARRAGRTWEQIGRAAGMSAPGANSRWKEPVAARAQLIDELDVLITDLDGKVVTASERVGLSITAVLAKHSNDGHRPNVADVQAMYARMAPTPP